MASVIPYYILFIALVHQALAQYLCLEQFQLLYGSGLGQGSNCSHVGFGSTSSLTIDQCKEEACTARANAINFRAGSQCQFKLCSNGELFLTTAEGGWDVYYRESFCALQLTHATKTDQQTSNCTLLGGLVQPTLKLEECKELACAAGANTLTFVAGFGCAFRDCINGNLMLIPSPSQNWDIYYRGSYCPRNFRKFVSVANRQATDCPHIGGISSSSITVDQCKEMACSANGNAFNYNPAIGCYYKSCPDEDLVIRADVGGWDVYYQYTCG